MFGKLTRMEINGINPRIKRKTRKPKVPGIEAVGLFEPECPSS